jgi:hypothetical protein
MQAYDYDSPRENSTAVREVIRVAPGGEGNQPEQGVDGSQEYGEMADCGTARQESALSL